MYYLINNEMDQTRSIYKHPRMGRFYRGGFTGLNGRYDGMKVYTCKTLKRILSLREAVHNYSGEWFDVYDENGKVNLDE